MIIKFEDLRVGDVARIFTKGGKEWFDIRPKEGFVSSNRFAFDFVGENPPMSDWAQVLILAMEARLLSRLVTSNDQFLPGQLISIEDETGAAEWRLGDQVKRQLWNMTLQNFRFTDKMDPLQISCLQDWMNKQKQFDLDVNRVKANSLTYRILYPDGPIAPPRYWPHQCTACGSPAQLMFNMVDCSLRGCRHFRA